MRPRQDGNAPLTTELERGCCSRGGSSRRLGEAATAKAARLLRLLAKRRRRWCRRRGGGGGGGLTEGEGRCGRSHTGAPCRRRRRCPERERLCRLGGGGCRSYSCSSRGGEGGRASTESCLRCRRSAASGCDMGIHGGLTCAGGLGPELEGSPGAGSRLRRSPTKRKARRG
jgi:hypothetical protein